MKDNIVYVDFSAKSNKKSKFLITFFYTLKYKLRFKKKNDKCDEHKVMVYETHKNILGI